MGFANTTQRTTTNDITGVVANTITFDSTAGAFTLNGNALTLNNGITNNSVKTAVFTVQSNDLYELTAGRGTTINIHENDLPNLHLPPGRPVVAGSKT